MLKLKRQTGGFTIVELLIVIVVVCVLAGLLVITYSGIQSKSRNATRQTDIQTLQNDVETFFSQNGYYPSLSDLNNSKWLAKNMQKLSQNEGVLVDPLSKCNPSTSKCLVGSPKAKAFSYAVTDANGNSCESDDTNCAKYILTATYEGTVNGSKTYTKINL
jgi:prepilin-type N-terminal cleavage/methylation domain-containing protein